MLNTTKSHLPSSKGKSSTGVKPWSQLPSEIIRLIATYYILDVSNSNYCPATWDLREHWPHRIIYAAFRDAFALEKLMTMCPSWGSALEWHRFWSHACCAIDPLDTLVQHTVTQHNDNTSSPQRVSPYHHFRLITQCSCYVCRINNPGSNVGLALAKRAVVVPLMGTILTCREHRKSTYCGLCLREAPPRCDLFTPEVAAVGCIENEDFETWPTVAATCRSCRNEWLWRRMNGAAPDREALSGGSPYWSSLDWEVRQSIDAFIEAGEGTLGEVLQVAREKHWLNRYTRVRMHMEHALAQQRLDMRSSGYVYENADEDAAAGEIDPDDYETLAMAEELHCVREMAQSDWARTRILDGLWLSPADDWYCHRPRHPPSAEHPVPWTLSSSDGQVHPVPATLRVPPAPTYNLADQLYRVFERQLRKILLPAMQNIIKRIMFQGRAEAMKAVITMQLEDVLRALQQAWAWSKDLRPLVHENDPDPGTPLDDACSSSKSDASHTTSPVLSTATLQTTPSPPPSDDKREKDGDAESPREEAPRMNIFTELGPPEPSNLLRDIPYVPTTLQEMPTYSLKAFLEVWRESYAPLFACSCKICERAMLHRDVGDTVRPTDTNYVVPSHPASYPQREQQQQHQTALGNTIRLDEAVYEEEEEEEEDDEEITYSDCSDGDVVACADGTDADVVALASRKRDHEGGGQDPRTHAETEDGGSKTPPKRSRLEGEYSPLTAAEVAAARISKRGSEEAALSSVAAGKRPRVVADGEAEGDEESTTPLSPSHPYTCRRRRRRGRWVWAQKHDKSV
ncbi:hypothetical protein BJV74DRAFT_43051 [Russula compacta]|nr:hypothetical protein BJV74DRAFT_43051 [Russula compacta]